MTQLGQGLLLCFAFHLTANVFPYDAKNIFVISKILQCCIAKNIWLAQSQNLYMAQLRQSLLTASTYYTYCSSVTSILYPTVKMSIFAQWNIKTSQSDLQEEKRVHALKGKDIQKGKWDFLVNYGLVETPQPSKVQMFGNTWFSIFIKYSALSF